VDKPAQSGFFGRYKAFGLVIDSGLPLPKLLPSSEEADITIRLGKVPKRLNTLLSESRFYQCNASQILITLETIARYFIQNGEEITIEVAQDSNEQSVQTILFGTGLAAVLHQRGALPLHGSALALGDEAILILGASGAGKSTTSAALMKRGLRLLSDDIAVIKLEENERPMVYAGIPQQNLWQETLDYFEKSSEALEELKLKLNKYVLPIRENFCEKDLPIRCIYILEPKETELELEALRGLESLHALAGQIFREQFLNPINGSSLLMKKLLMLANAVPIRRIHRPKAMGTPAAVAQLIETDLGKKEE
jgi:hypothetical protein